MKFLAENINLQTTVSMNVTPLERNVATATSTLKKLNGQLKAQSRAFKGAEMDATELGKREKWLGEAIDEQKVKINAKRAALEKVSSQVKDNNAATQKEIRAVNQATAALSKEEYALKGLQSEMTRTRNAQKMMSGEISGLKSDFQQLDAATSRSIDMFKKMDNASGALRAEYKGLSAQVNKHGQVLDKEQANLKQTEYALGRSSDEYKQQTRVVEEATRKQQALEARQAQVGRAIDKGRTSVGRSTEQMKQMGDRYKSVGDSMRGVGQGMVAGITLPVSLGLGMAIKKSMDFEGQMSKVGAISGATSKEMKAMKDQAIDLGAKTSLSATEVADGMKEMSAKGFTANQTMKAMPGIIAAAEASGTSMAETSNVVASALNGFGLEAKDSTHIADVLAEAANKSSADIGDLGMTFKYVAPIAKTLGMSLEDSSAAAMVMADAGIDASTAGTSMRMSLLRMAKPTAKGKEEMDKLGVSLTDAEGNFVGLPKIIEQFKTGMQGMTKEQKLATVSNIVGTEASSAFLTLIDAGPKKLDKYSNSLKNSDGASAKAAKQMKDNLKGAVEQLGGAFESLGLIIGEALTPFLKALATAVTWVVDKLSGMPKWVITTITVVALLAAAIGPVLVGLGALAASIGAIAGSSAIMAILGAIGTALGALIGPIGIAIGTIVALGAAFVIAYKKSETFRNIVNGALQGVVNGFRAMWGGIKTIGSAIGAFIMKNIIGPIASFGTKIMAQIMAFWNQNGPMIMQALQNIWNVASPILTALFNLFKTVFQGILGVVVSVLKGLWMVAAPILTAFGSAFMAIWNFIKAQFQNVWSMIKGIVQGALNVILGIVKVFGGLFTGNWSAVWSGLGQIVMGLLGIILAPIKFLLNTIKNTLVLFGSIIKAIWFGIWGALKGIVLGIVGVIVAIVKGLFNGLVAFLNFLWTSIKVGATVAWNAIKFAVVNPVRSLVSIVRNNWTVLKAFTTVIFNIVKVLLLSIWTVIKNRVVGLVRGLWAAIRGIWNVLSKVTRLVFGALRAFFVTVWTTIKNRVVALVRGLWSIMRGVWNTLSKVSRAIFSSVRNFIVSVWTNLRNRIVAISRALWNIIRSIWNTLSKVSRSIFSNVRNFVVSVWTNLRNRVVSISRSLWNVMRGIWNTLSKVSRTIFNNLRIFFSNTWSTIRSRVTSLARSMWNIMKGIWNVLNKITRQFFNNLRIFFSNIWSAIRRTVTTIVRSLWNAMRGTWNVLSKTTRNIFTGVKNSMIKTWQTIKNSVTGIASSLWGAVRKTFTNMSNGLKGLAGKMGSTINNMVKGIRDGLQKLINGVNWVGKKLGISTKIPELPKFSTGTEGASSSSYVSNGAISRPTLATVNDRGRGNGFGGATQEVIQKADGSMYAPKGKNVTVPLGKGDIVHSGRAVQKAQRAGVIPKFASGTGSNNLLKDAKKKKKKKGDEEHGAMDAIGSKFGVGSGGKLTDKLAELTATGLTTSKPAAKKIGDLTQGVKATAGTAGNWIKDKATDLLEWVGKPGKLLDKVLGAFGVKFPKVEGQIPKDMMWDPMWKSLKAGTRSLFDGWLTEAEGAGDGGYIDLSKGINYGFGSPPGYPFGRHDGLDINYKYGEKLYSTLSGMAVGKSGYNGGFGRHMNIKGDNGLTAIYGHMSKLAFNKKRVKPGSYLGKSGGDPGRDGANAGMSTGAHLHYEMRKKNGQPFDPTNWLKKNNGGGGASGKWSGNIKKALKLAGLPTSGAYVKAWAKQIQTESGGNPKALGGDDGLADGRAKGLVQVKPGTFNAYKLPGHGNIWNGLDNLIAGIRYAKSRYGAKGMLSVIGKGHGYAKGTDAARAGLANVFEKGGEIMNLRGGEQIIPNDVSINALKQMMSSDLFARTQSAVYAGISQYADALRQKETAIRDAQLRLQNQTNANSSDINQMKQMMADMTFLMGQMVNATQDIAQTNRGILGKDTSLNSKVLTNEISKEMAMQNILGGYNGGQSLI